MAGKRAATLAVMLVLLVATAHLGQGTSCPRNGVKLSACVSALGGAIKASAGRSELKAKCCPAVHGLADADAAACFCLSVKESILGVVQGEWSVGLRLLANACGRSIPPEFKCA